MPPPAASLRARIAPRALAAVAFGFWVSLYLYVPLLPGHSRDLGAGAAWVGFITGSYGFAQLVLRIPLGIWSDRLGRRRPFVLAGCGVAALSAVGLGVAGGPVGLLVARFVGGVAASSYLAFTVLYAGYFPTAPSTAVTRMVAITNLGVVVGITIGPLTANVTGTTGVFWLAAGVGAAAVAGTLAATTEPPPAARGPEAGDEGTLRTLFANRALVRVSLIAAVIQYVIQGAWLVFVFDWAEVELGAGPSELGLLALFSGAPAAIAAYAGGRWLAPRVGAVAVIVAGFGLAAVSVALVPVVPSLGWLLVLQVAGGIARGLTFPVLMGMALVTVSEERRAGAIGFFQATYAVGMTLGPVVTGAVGDAFGLAGGFWVTAALAGIAGVVSIRVLPRSRGFA